MKTNPNRKATITEDKGPARLLGLSDALFATVLTLLVLDLRIPDMLHSNGGNLSAIIHWLGPHLFGYLLTFLVAGTYWIAHHRNFEYVIRSDRALLGYNLLFLLFIGFLPFTTASISGGSSQSSEFRFFWCIYAANMALAGVMLELTWAYASSHHLVAVETTRQQSRHITARQLVTPAVFLLSLLAEWIFPLIILGPLILLVIPLAVWWIDFKYAEAKPHGDPLRNRTSELLWRAGRVLPWFLILGLAIWMLSR